MITLNKTELGWIRDAIENDIARMEQLLSDNSNQPLMPQLAALRRDNLHSVLDKLNTVISSGAKRIAIR